MKHVWNNKILRSNSFNCSKLVHNAIFNDIKPVSIKRPINKYRYQSPQGIHKTFQMAYDFLEQRADKNYTKLLRYKERENTNDANHKTSNIQLNEKDTENKFIIDNNSGKLKNLSPTEIELLVKAEINNPQVQYNFQFSKKIDNNAQFIDYNQPVYRHLAKREWESHDLMLLMQRLETMRVIPDTLPTLVPRANLMVKFPYASTNIDKWIEPGLFLNTVVTSREPVFKIQDFDMIDVNRNKYCVLMVDPDIPDLENDSFKTQLCYGLFNLSIQDYNDNVIDSRKFNQNQIILDYLPPVPEKNSGNHRLVTWLFRQDDTIDNLKQSTVMRDNFNIREFTKQNNLLPIGAHMFRSKWDLNVAQVRQEYGLPKGRIFTRIKVH